MTREQMITILLNEQRDDISADIERSNIADQLKADGEMIERLAQEIGELHATIEKLNGLHQSALKRNVEIEAALQRAEEEISDAISEREACHQIWNDFRTKLSAVFPNALYWPMFQTSDEIVAMLTGTRQERDTALARVAELEAALRPFAAALDGNGEVHSVADLCRAREALKGSTSG